MVKPTPFVAAFCLNGGAGEKNPPFWTGENGTREDARYHIQTVGKSYIIEKDKTPLSQLFFWGVHLLAQISFHCPLLAHFIP